jgi:SAM-dependent methyltransferase
VQERGVNREGAQAISCLNDVIARHLKGNLLDYGCGKGRLAQLVPPLVYLGYDINPKMIEQAQRDNPDYTFTRSLNAALSYGADTTLLYTVISMMGDDELCTVLEQIHSRLIIIGEIADARWATGPNSIPQIYNRNIEQIDMLMFERGYVPIDHQFAEHEHYAGWANDFDKRMHILVYERTNS